MDARDVCYVNTEEGGGEFERHPVTKGLRIFRSRDLFFFRGILYDERTVRRDCQFIK